MKLGETHARRHVLSRIKDHGLSHLILVRLVSMYPKSNHVFEVTSSFPWIPCASSTSHLLIVNIGHKQSHFIVELQTINFAAITMFDSITAMATYLVDDPLDFHPGFPAATPEVLESSSSAVVTVVKTNQFFEIRPSQRHGMGVFAIRAIKEHTLILSERPIIHLDSVFSPEKVLAQFNRLSKKARAAFMSLHSSHDIELDINAEPCPEDCCVQKTMTCQKKLEEDKVLWARKTDKATPQSVFVSNMLESNGHFVTGLKYARFNHDCTPNAHACWNSTTKRIEVRMIRAVQAEEVSDHPFSSVHPQIFLLVGRSAGGIPDVPRITYQDLICCSTRRISRE